jgi:hypothetical protein
VISAGSSLVIVNTAGVCCAGFLGLRSLVIGAFSSVNGLSGSVEVTDASEFRSEFRFWYLSTFELALLRTEEKSSVSVPPLRTFQARSKHLLPTRTMSGYIHR